MISFYTDEAVLSGMISHYGKTHLQPIVDHWVDTMSEGETIDYPILMALALYGEARDQPDYAIDAVGAVMMNRANKANKRMIEPILLKQWQFSCFNLNDRSLAKADKAATGMIIKFCELAKQMLYMESVGLFQSDVGNATIYCTKDALSACVVRWACRATGAWNFNIMTPCGQYGDHFFFSE